jgi:4-alpha-glucanotransferase
MHETARQKLARPRPRKGFRFDRRTSGILLHPTSLPGPHGSGDIGRHAYRFVDFLASAGQRWWQMLPVNPPGSPPGNSPYSSTSAFAGSPWLVSLDTLVEQGLLSRPDVEPASAYNGAGSINFPASQRYRLQRLRKAFATFESRGGSKHDDFARFTAAQADWLDDYALYNALRDRHDGASWSTWSLGLRLRRPQALREARQSLAEGIRFQQFVQYQFDRQWTALKRYCHERDVGLIGDVPIFVAHDSADVWAQRHLFLLDDYGRPTTVSGYPPDAFNADGQKWGHPHYNWPAHEKNGFAWWIARFAHTLRQFEAARIDHFLGFEKTWHIPARARTARRGEWVATPGDRLFLALRKALGPATIIAEDLGRVTRQAADLRDKYNFPGMRIIQFGFGDDEYHLPHQYVRRCVAYPGTHDNSTIVGWFEHLRAQARQKGRNTPQREYEKVKRYVGGSSKGIHWEIIRIAMMSVADTVVFPIQDVLGLDDDSRMNRPGTPEGNWDWRLKPGHLSPAVAKRLAEMTQTYSR